MKQSIQQWQAALRKASSEGAVLDEVRRYLASLTEEQMGALPESSRPISIEGPDDLMAFNLQVARDELMSAGDSPGSAVLREMVAVLSEAANRLTSMSLDMPSTRS